jgi:hypothetical protein
MVMKKTSGGDSPLRQGAGKSFWTLPIFGSTAAADRDVFWKSDRVFRFSRRGVFIGEEAASEVDQGAHTTRRRGPGVGRAPWWCGHPLVWLCLLFGVLEAL